jgi:hypothetical protein
MLSAPWPGLLVWVALFISDYTMTLLCARMYQAGVKEKLVFEGSYEITPYFQKDIDSLRVISPRFLLALVFNGLLMSIVWWCSYDSEVPQLYDFMLGAVICIQLVVHTRHWRNFFSFRAMLNNDSIRGRMEYPRTILLKLSSSECLVFAGFFLILFVFTENWFVLGGSVGCVSLALKHWRFARKHAMQLTNPAVGVSRS